MSRFGAAAGSFFAAKEEDHLQKSLKAPHEAKQKRSTARGGIAMKVVRILPLSTQNQALFTALETLRHSCVDGGSIIQLCMCRPPSTKSSW